MTKPIRISETAYDHLCQLQNGLRIGGRRPQLMELAEVAIRMLHVTLDSHANPQRRWDTLREWHLGNVTDE